jgi:N-acyl-D-aspartate/D-glutamate deacylase
MREHGLDISAVCIPRGSGFVSGLQSNLLWNTPAWKRLGQLPVAERLEVIASESAAAQLVAEAAAADSKFAPEQVFWLGAGERPNYVGGPEASLAALAEAAGEHPAATYLRLARESGGRGLFTVRFFNRNIDALARLFGEDYCLPGLGDAGAHVSQIMDSGWATFVLSHWHRDAGFYGLEEAVRRLTSAPARIIGLKDRGTLQTGRKADINVIDLARLGERMPEIVNDFPGGAPRFIQRAAGYHATLCNGRVVLRDDELTGERSGVVVRN